ncbi:MAG: DUF2794 domain-containing protein [Pseudomonadota bacterium]
MSESEPIQLKAVREERKAQAVSSPAGGSHMLAGQSALASPAATASAAADANGSANQVCFTRLELNQILNVYGRKVALGDWRDYAMDFARDRAVFSIYRRSSEVPLYRVEKHPKLARKQGAFCVIGAGGQVLKRGHDLRRVLSVIDKSLSLVDH